MRIVFVGCIGIMLAAYLLCACGETKWEPQIMEEEIVIHGLKGEYEVLFLTDTHMIVKGEGDSQQIQDNALSRYETFRNNAGVPSAEQFGFWMEYANTEELDGVLLGGDIIDYPSEANLMHMKTNLETLQMPYLYTMGNHDWTYPWEYMTDYGRETYIPMVKESLGGNSSVTTLDLGEVIVVAVDNSTNQVSEQALEACKEALTEGKPTIVLLHVPLLTQSVLTRAREVWGENGVVLGGGNYGGIYPDECSQQFMNLITAEDSPVAAVLAGHVHFYDKDYIDGEKRVLQIVGDGGFRGSAVRLRITGDAIVE
uniref:metallophosphoesterase family protein n=1 Tax=Acetatifactor sp. TaxID=1872090 RepID=UPI0040563567